MHEKKMSDVPLGHPMFQTTNRIGWTQLLNSTPEEKKIFKVFDFYLTHSILKEKERTGWKKWNVATALRIVRDGGNFYGVCHGLDQAVSFIEYKSTYPKDF